jgi:uncharacterized delta-60 repeat protein
MINKSWLLVVLILINLVVSCRDKLETNPIAPSSLLTVETGPSGSDTTQPTIVSFSPTGSGITLNPTVSVTFSEPMNQTTINSSTFMLLDELALPVSGTISNIDSRTAQFVPDSSLSNYSLYTAQVTVGVTDVAGNSLAANQSWSFTTVAKGTVGAPSFNPTSPYTAEEIMYLEINGDAGSTIIYTTGTVASPPPDPDPLVPIGTTCSPGDEISFSTNTVVKAMAFIDGWGNSSITTGDYYVTPPTPVMDPYAGWTYGPGLTVTIDGSGYNIRYRINSGSWIDAPPAPASFTINTTSTIEAYTYAAGMSNSATVPATYTIDGTGPIVSSIIPADDAYSVNTGSPIIITFSESMDPATVNVSTADNSCSGSIQISWDNFNPNTCAKFTNGVAPDGSNTIFTINPASGELDLGTFYKIRVTTGVQDAYGNPMAADYETANGFLTYTRGVADTTFNATGIVTTDNPSGGDYGTDLAVQPDTTHPNDVRIVVAGNFVGKGSGYYSLVRYLTDGSLDTGEFQSPNGMFIDNFGDSSYCRSIGIQSIKNTIVVAGSNLISNSDFAFAGYSTNDGSLVSGFGKKIYDLRTYDDSANAMAINVAERIVAVGSSSTGLKEEFAVTRFMPDGIIDGSFNGGAVYEQFLGYPENMATAVAIDPGVNPLDPADDRIVTVGFSNDLANLTPNRFAITCHDNNGNLDTSFNGTGKRTEGFGLGGNDIATAVAIQSDHKIIVAGNSETSFGSGVYDFALVRYYPDGTIDTMFGTGGTVRLDIGNDDQVAAIAIQRDGKIVIAGNTSTGPNTSNVVIVRLNTDGSLDTSFGPPSYTGILIFDISGYDDVANAMMLQPNGRIVIAGASNNGTDYDYLVMRLR